MKTRITLFLLLFISCQSLFAQEVFVTEDAKLSSHPRLLLPKGGEKALKKQIQKDAIWKDVHAAIMDESNTILTTPPNERKQIGRRLLGVSRENLRRIFFLSYAYRMSGDKKYVKRAEEEMLKAANFSDWNPSHFLDVGEMTMALAIGYDWLYGQLSPQSKQIIETAIIEKGLNPSFDKRYNWFVDANHNWNQVCHGGMTYGAIAVWEKNPSLAAKVVNRAIEKIAIPMKHYGPDGAYPEGVGYWEYGTSFNVMFLSAIEGVFKSDFGLSEIPGFLETGDYLLHMVTPGLKNFCYSDNGSKAFFTPTIFWFYNKTKNPSIIYNQSRLIKQSGVSSVKGTRLAPAMLLWGALASLDNPVKPTELFWMGQGDSPVGVMRSDWDKEDATFLGVKLGSPSINHGHMDIGSFIFEADGVNWAIDMGGEEYNRLETRGVELWGREQDAQRWDVFRYNNLAHSTLAFNDKYQLVKGNAIIDKHGKEENNMYVISDLTPVYANEVQKIVRAVSLIDKKYAVIEDNIVNRKRFTKLSWRLVTPATAKVISTQVVELNKDGKTLYLKVEGVNSPVWDIKPAKSTYSYDSENPGISIITLNSDLKPSEERKITVYLLPGENKNISYKSKF